MHPRHLVDEALTMVGSGSTTREVAEALGVPAGTIRHWRQGNRRTVERTPACPRCNETPPAAEYPYLLGAYLGDGHITVGRRGVASLSIACGDVWPGIKDDVEAALGPSWETACAGWPGKAARRSRATRSTGPVCSRSTGPDASTTGRSSLEEWQAVVVDASPALFLRGLFHSEGCRMTNWTRRTVNGVEKRYEYPRWFFSNKSLDILDLCSASLDRLGSPIADPAGT